MKRGEIVAGTIEPDMLQSTFTETPGHHTLGHAIGIDKEVGRSAETLPVGTKVFVMSEHSTLQDDALYDSVGMIMGHSAAEIKVITLSPKHNGRWGMHNGYGELKASEVADAIAALDRLFDPNVEFGSIAVLSEATGSLFNAATTATVGEAGCNSHESKKLGSTLSVSQLLDTYNWQAVSLTANSKLLRRDEDGQIIHLLPGQAHRDQPDKESRDQLSMLDRIQRLAAPGTRLSGFSEVAILRGIEAAVSSGAFDERGSYVEDIAGTIQRGAERLAL